MSGTDTTTARPFTGSDTWNLPKRIDSICVPLGDTAYVSPVATGGFLPELLILGSQTAGVQSGRVVVYTRSVHNLRLSSNTLGYYLTPLSMDSTEPGESLGLGIYAACKTLQHEARFTRAIRRIRQWASPAESASVLAVAAVAQPRAREAARVEAEAAALLRVIRTYLPDWSEERLGNLLGVSRQSWRSWERADSTPRPHRVRAILLLRHVLQTFRSAQPDTSPAVWLQTPIWAGRADTPESLFRAGRGDILAALALRRSPAGLDAPLSRHIDVSGTVERLASRSATRAQSPNDES
jgi:hypothetical protein